jgi:hypothetical protein
MAVLSNADRAELSTAIIRALSEGREPLSTCVKADIRAAVNAADDWANTNAASYNSALPLPFRTAATSDQKSRLLEAVISKRRQRAS